MPVIPSQQYSQKQIESFTKRLAEGLLKDGLDADTIVQDAEMKQFVDNYVKTEIVEKKTALAIQGIVMRLVHMEINSPGFTKPRVFPLVHEYKGHDLTRARYFAKNPDNTYRIETVDFIQTHHGILLSE